MKREITKSRLAEFRDFHNGIEHKFKSDIKRVSERFDEETKNFDDYEKQELAEFYGQEDSAIRTYIEIHRKSATAALYAIIESSLDNVCRYVYKKKNSKEQAIGKHTECTGKDKGIDRAKKYLKKHTKIEFQNFNTEWCKVKDLNKIRNCLVHCSGNPNFLKRKDIEPLKKVVNSSNGLSLIGKHEIIKIKKEFVDEAIENTLNFVEKLYEELLLWLKTEDQRDQDNKTNC